MASTIKLQGIYTQQKGTPAKKLKVGDVIIWNYGYKSKVREIHPSKTGKTITFMLESLESGNVNPRKMGAERLVVVEEKPEHKKPENKIVKTIKEKPEQKTKSAEEAKNRIARAIKNRKETHYGIYSDIGTALDKFTTAELADYYINILKCESDLRYYLEQQIIGGEINKIKYAD